MGVETALMGVGLASQLYQGYKKGKDQKANQKAQQQQQGMSNDYILKALGGQGAPSAGETGLEAFLRSIGAGGSSGIENSPSFNSAQDALTQMVNRSAADQLGNAGVQLNDLATNGGAQDVSKLLAALGVQQNYATNEQAARLNASTSGLGQLAGTASRIGEARLRGQAQRDNNVLNAGIQNQAMENAQNRRLSAAGTLGGLNLGAGQLNLGAAQGLAGLAGLLQSGQLQSQGQQIQGYGLLGQLGLGRSGQANQLISLLTGNRPTPGPEGSPFADALGSTAQDALLFPYLLKRLKKPPTPPTPATGG